MSAQNLFRRLCSVEVVGGAVLGAMAPYLVSLATQVAPLRVPIGLVAATMALGALLGWLVFAVKRRRQRRRVARERRERESQTLRAQLVRIERAVLNRPDEE